MYGFAHVDNHAISSSAREGFVTATADVRRGLEKPIKLAGARRMPMGRWWAVQGLNL
jgi:hypothetical protein